MPWSQKDADLAHRLLRPEYLSSEFLGYMNDYSAVNMAPIPASNIMGLSSAMVPVGVPVMWLRGDPPTGYVLLDGTAVSRTDYVLLYELWGTAFGVGDGSTTFNLPDFRGRVPVGLGTHTTVDTLGETDGLAVGSRSVKHSHTVTDPGHSHSNTPHSHTYDYGDTAAPPIDAAGPAEHVAGSLSTDTTSITIASNTTGITVGSATGSVDGAAFIVVHYITRYLVSATPQPVTQLDQPHVDVTETAPPTSTTDL